MCKEKSFGQVFSRFCTCALLSPQRRSEGGRSNVGASGQSTRASRRSVGMDMHRMARNELVQDLLFVGFVSSITGHPAC